ncbi:hypothetical protein B4U80_00248, partial [Leptotrombidium deliense]
FDEPSFKATFSITIIAPKDRTVVSNMPVSSSTVTEKEKKTVFQKTPKMSTYLVCFVVGDYDFVEKSTPGGGVKVRIYTRIGRKEEGLFALNVAVKSVVYLQNYLGVNYTLPKLDIVGVRDHDASAMENWGLILHKESVLYINETTSPITQQISVAYIIAHEVTHQWFGNLVTMKWWTHIWLNEGFAEFMECMITNVFFEKWRFWRYCLEADYESALQLDSFHSIHPINIPKLNQSENDIIFDGIIYKKGASVIKMIKHFVGKEKFRKSLKRYIRKNQYANTETNDILKSFDEVSGKRITQMMSAWLNKKGYPVIKVEENGECLGIRQEKFSIDGMNNEEERKMLWKVPIIYKADINGSTKTFVLRKRSERCLSKTIFNLNIGSVGFYRTQYTDKQYEQLFNQLKAGKLKAEHRFHLHHDYFAFAMAGMKSPVEYLKYLKMYAEEEEYFIWKSIDSSISNIKELISNANCTEEINKFVTQLYSKINEKLKNTKKNDDFTKLLQVLIYSRLGKSGNKEIIDDSFKRFDDYYNKQIIDPNYRSAVFEMVASKAPNNSNDYYHKLIQVFKKSDDINERKEITKALGSSENDEQLKLTLELSLTTEVTLSECSLLIESVADSKPELAFRFVAKNVNILRYKFEESLTKIIRVSNPFSDERFTKGYGSGELSSATKTSFA